MPNTDIQKYIASYFNINEKVIEFVDACESEIAPYFEKVKQISQANQYKVTHAFKKNNVSVRHFAPTTGYGYSDEGREKLARVFAAAFDAEDAIASPLLMSGTHAITTALFGLLRPGDGMLCATGRPYDTFAKVIASESGLGSLKEWGIRYFEQPLSEDHKININQILTTLSENPAIKLLYIQRSCGYDIRPAVTITQIEETARAVHRQFSDAIIMVDNCYGEFTELKEPTTVGADVIVGSLIKNPGGGLAPTGGYIAGMRPLIEKIAHRFTAPGIGAEIGSYAYSYQPFFQGLFMAPHTVSQALMGVMLAASVFKKLGFEVFPEPDAERSDITQTILFKNEETLTQFIRAIQKASAIDGNVVPYAWEMPGYEDKVIMAAGTFVQGASLELTADAPIREPFAAYMQGALTYEHAKLGILYAVQELKKNQ